MLECYECGLHLTRLHDEPTANLCRCMFNAPDYRLHVSIPIVGIANFMNGATTIEKLEQGFSLIDRLIARLVCREKAEIRSDFLP